MKQSDTNNTKPTETDNLVTQDSSELITLYNKIIERDPNDTEAYYIRGNEYRRLGQRDLAFADYTNATELDPVRLQQKWDKWAR